MIQRVKKSVLAVLLFHANSIGDAQWFFDIKGFILKSFGQFDGRVVQFIAGVSCWSCDGTGKWSETKRCSKCLDGYYKLPLWIIHDRYRMGPYSFLVPIERCTSRYAWFDEREIFSGYVKHVATKYAPICLMLLRILFRSSRRRYFKNLGKQWYHFPHGLMYLDNIVHVFRYGWKSVPARRLILSIQQSSTRIFPRDSRRASSNATSDGDLPF